METRLKRNIKVIYALSFFHTFMLIVPVLVPFFQSKGLTLAEVFYLQAIYAAAIVLLEAPSGYFADVLGRRFVLIIGAAAHGLGYLWLNFADDFYGLMIFELILGFAMSMLSGADLALLYDSEKALAKEDMEHAPGVAHLGFTKSIAEGSGALLGGVLAMLSFDLMVLMQSVTAWICLLLALLITEPPLEDDSTTQAQDNTTPQKRPAVSFKEIWQHVVNGDPVLRMVFIALPVYNVVTVNVAWLVQPYWDNMGLSLALFGVLWCAQSMTVAMATQCGFALEKKKGPVYALWVIGLLPIAGVFAMAWASGWIGLAFGFLLFFCRGLYQVILVNALNRRVPGRFRATVNSLNSLLFRFGFMVTGPALGFVADHHGLSAALSLVGTGSALAFVVVMLPLINAVKQLPSARAQKG